MRAALPPSLQRSDGPSNATNHLSPGTKAAPAAHPPLSPAALGRGGSVPRQSTHETRFIASERFAASELCLSRWTITCLVLRHTSPKLHTQASACFPPVPSHAVQPRCPSPRHSAHATLCLSFQGKKKSIYCSARHSFTVFIQISLLLRISPLHSWESNSCPTETTAIRISKG